VEIRAAATVLATGGSWAALCGRTNHIARFAATGWRWRRRGAAVLDPEFVPVPSTAIDLGLDPAPLATEALRGEGAILVDQSGASIMAGVHPAGDLAPRDVVARALHIELG
jgi:L-aspartate oxidase